MIKFEELGTSKNTLKHKYYVSIDNKLIALRKDNSVQIAI